MNYLRNRKLYLFLIIVLLFFSSLVFMNYSVDTYLLFASPKFRYVYEYLSSGRIFTTIFFFVQGFLKIPYNIIYLSSYTLAIIFATLSIFELNKIIDKYVPNKWLSIILSVAIIINPFVIELWLFIESGIMMFSILMSVLAFKYYDRFLEKSSKKNLVYSFIMMLLALFSYQGTVGIFVVLSAISEIEFVYS